MKRTPRASLVTLAIALFCSAGSLAAENDPTRPNIVLIMSDDMGFSDIGCYGGEIDTPNLDRLASRGLRFTQFYNTARCCPTRAALLTGVYSHQAGIGLMTGNGNLPGYRSDLGRNVLTIAEALGTAGYRAYMSGKWHVTRFTSPDGPQDNWPLQRGFDRFYGTITGAGSFYDPATLCRGNTYITPVNDPKYQPVTYYYTDATSDNAVMFLGEHGEKAASRPFFLYVAYTCAHWPMHALPQDIAKYRGKYNRGFTPIRESRLKRVKELGLVDPGTELSPPSDDWEQVPDKARVARNMEVYAAMIDIMATCVDVADVAYPSRLADHDVVPLEGVSLKPTFSGDSLDRSDALYFEHHLNCAIRDGDWKLVRKGQPGKEAKLFPWELCDMSKDRAELCDLAQKYPEKVANLSAKWETWAARAHVKPWPWNIAPDRLSAE